MRSILGLALASLVVGCAQLDVRPSPSGESSNASAGVAAEPAAPRPTRFAVPIEGLPKVGRDDAEVTVVAFTDYECPFCARAEATLGALRALLGDELRVVVAPHPLPMHAHARDAALAALAASTMPAASFATFHARLFAQPTGHDVDDLVRLASELGAPPAVFRAALDAPETAAALAHAEALAASLHVTGTPTFFVNGRRIDGAQPLERFAAVAREEQAHARELQANGLAKNRVYAAILADAEAHPPPPDESPRGVEAPAFVPESKTAGGAAYLGAAAASHTILVFADYQCPYSRRLDGQLRAFAAEHPDVRVVVRNRPLPFHDHARLAARAAIAADLQGKLEPYAASLYANAGALGRDDLVGYAVALGLDRARFLADLDGEVVTGRLAADEALGEKLAVTGTPTSFVDGVRVIGAQPPATFVGALAEVH